MAEMGFCVSFLAATAGPESSAQYCISIPAEAVRSSGSTGTIFIGGDKQLEQRAVCISATSGDRISVFSAVGAG